MAGHAQPSDDGEIVVQGQSIQQIRSQATAYVKELGVATGETPTSRWFDPICPRAIGLGQQEAAIVEKGVREVARKIGAWVAKEGCRTNLIIAFTDDARAVTQKISRGSILGSTSPSVVNALKQSEAPIRWWYEIGARSSDATTTQADAGPQLSVTNEDGSQAATLNTNGGQVIVQSGSSNISTKIVRAISYATIIVDVERAKGVTLKAITEYAALVGLAEIKFGAAPQGSVLAMFSGQEQWRGLTSRDEAFLTALYRTSMDRRSEQQRRSIVSSMVSSAGSGLGGGKRQQ
jgi:hypothetical protein